MLHEENRICQMSVSLATVRGLSWYFFFFFRFPFPIYMWKSACPITPLNKVLTACAYQLQLPIYRSYLFVPCTVIPSCPIIAKEIDRRM
jgi:hypothetical protein